MGYSFVGPIVAGIVFSFVVNDLTHPHRLEDKEGIT